MSERAEREIVIRLKIPATPRARWLVAIGAGVLTCAAVAYAADFSPFAAHEKLSAAKMNQNFTDLQTRIAALEATTATMTHNGAYSVGATFCGATGATFTGTSFQSYAGAKAQCQTVSGCGAAAHLCSGEELARSVALGVGPADNTSGWYAGGGASPSGASVIMDDCHGWRTSASNFQGATWTTNLGNSEGGPDADQCATAQHPLFCCM